MFFIWSAISIENQIHTRSRTYVTKRVENLWGHVECVETCGIGLGVAWGIVRCPGGCPCNKTIVSSTKNTLPVALSIAQHHGDLHTFPNGKIKTHTLFSKNGTTFRLPRTHALARLLEIVGRAQVEGERLETIRSG